MKKSGIQYLLLWLFLVGTVVAISTLSPKTPSAPAQNAKDLLPVPTAMPTIVPVTKEEEEFVGIWIPYMSLSVRENTPEAFQKNFFQLAIKAKELGVNNLFVHVRPFSDALYPSKYYPWSHIVSGKQGEDPGFDPLEYMIQITHEQGMKFHAWINPLRVKTERTPPLLAEDNPYTQMSQSNPYYFLTVGGNTYLNPAYSEMRKLITDGVGEIVQDYPVDGIHFDDYFYPEGIKEQDGEDYAAYCENAENPLSLGDWRIANINTMIAQVYREIKSVRPEVSFGISPQGNINNNKALGADVFSWCSTKGYIDYICPQIYFSYENPALGFQEAMVAWLELPAHENLKMYIGLGLYKAGTDSDGGTWQQEDDIIARQIEEVRKLKCDGFVLYDISAAKSEAASAEIANMEKVLHG
ncbi:MAG: family 10 glycosylhydrolase [Oscillospiraceae bacterium]